MITHNHGLDFLTQSWVRVCRSACTIKIIMDKSGIPQHVERCAARKLNRLPWKKSSWISKTFCIQVPGIEDEEEEIEVDLAQISIKKRKRYLFHMHMKRN